MRPGSRKRAAGAAQMQGPDPLALGVKGVEGAGRVLHVFEFEVGGIRGVHARGLHAVDEEGRQWAVPPDLGRSGVDLMELAPAR